MFITLERQCMWVEIFEINKMFVELFSQGETRARSSGGRAQLWPSVEAEAQGKSAQPHPATGRKTGIVPDGPPV